MNKALLALLFAFVLLFQSLICLAYVKADLVSEGSITYFAPPPYIVSPTNTTYSSGQLVLNVSFEAAIFGNVNYSMTYSLDRRENQSVPLNLHYFGFLNQSQSYIDGQVNLSTLSSGSHELTVYLEYTLSVNMSSSPNGPIQVRYNTGSDSQTVYFYVSDGSSSNAQAPAPTATPAPTISPTPTLKTNVSIPLALVSIIAVVLILIIVILSLLLYLAAPRLRKIKHSVLKSAHEATLPKPLTLLTVTALVKA